MAWCLMGWFAVEEGIAETPVTVLRNRASLQSVMIPCTHDQPEMTALWTSGPVKGLGVP